MGVQLAIGIALKKSGTIPMLKLVDEAMCS